MTALPSPSPSSGGTPSTVKAGLHLKRPCLLVSDLQRALALYQGILGFRLDYVGEASPDSYLYPVFKIPAHAKLAWAALSTDHEPRAIALTEVKGIDLPRCEPPHQIGIVIQVSKLSTVMQHIQTLCLEVIPPNSFTAPPNLMFTEQGFYDFDGHLIILYETTIQ